MTDWLFTPEEHIVLILDIIKGISIITMHIIQFAGVLIELKYGWPPVNHVILYIIYIYIYIYIYYIYNIYIYIIYIIYIYIYIYIYNI